MCIPISEYTTAFNVVCRWYSLANCTNSRAKGQLCKYQSLIAVLTLIRSHSGIRSNASSGTNAHLERRYSPRNQQIVITNQFYMEHFPNNSDDQHTFNIIISHCMLGWRIALQCFWIGSSVGGLSDLM